MELQTLVWLSFKLNFQSRLDEGPGRRGLGVRLGLQVTETAESDHADQSQQKESPPAAIIDCAGARFHGWNSTRRRPDWQVPKVISPVTCMA
jgi:hypothetical protein